MRFRKASLAGAALAAAAALALWLAPRASAMMVLMSLKDLVAQSDDVVVAACESKSSRWVSGHIETVCKFKITESLVGAKAAKSPLELTLLGGVSPGPLPVAMDVSEVPDVGEGEEMVLFLRNLPGEAQAKLTAKMPETGLAASPAIVGGLQGKWVVTTDQATGARRVQGMGPAMAESAGKAPAVAGPAAARRYEDFRREVVTLAGKRANAEAAKAVAAEGAADVTVQEPAGDETKTGE